MVYVVSIGPGFGTDNLCCRRGETIGTGGTDECLRGRNEAGEEKKERERGYLRIGKDGGFPENGKTRFN